MSAATLHDLTVRTRPAGGAVADAVRSCPRGFPAGYRRIVLFVPVLAGLYLRRAGTPEALAAIGAGIVALAAVHLAAGGRGYGFLSPVLAGLLAAAAACAASLGRRRRPPAAG